MRQSRRPSSLEEVHVSVLASGGAETLDTMGADPVLDDQALAEYRRRWADKQKARKK